MRDFLLSGGKFRAKVNFGSLERVNLIFAHTATISLIRHNDLTRLGPLPGASLRILVDSLPEELSLRLQEMKVTLIPTTREPMYKCGSGTDTVRELLRDVQPHKPTCIESPEQMLCGYLHYTTPTDYIKEILYTLDHISRTDVHALVHILEVDEPTFVTVVKRIKVDLLPDWLLSTHHSNNFRALLRVIRKITEMTEQEENSYWTYEEIEDFCTFLNKRLTRNKGEIKAMLNESPPQLDKIEQMIEVWEMRTSLLGEISRVLVESHKRHFLRQNPTPSRVDLIPCPRINFRVKVVCNSLQEEYERAVDHVHNLQSKISSFQVNRTNGTLIYLHWCKWKGDADKFSSALEKIKALYPHGELLVEELTKKDARYTITL